MTVSRIAASYEQAQGVFVGGLSVLDALMNLGPEAAARARYA
jgi:hypothetical protein